MKTNKIFFSKILTAAAVFGSLFLTCDFADAATRVSTARAVPASRKNVSSNVQATNNNATQETATTTEEITPQVEEETPELIIQNKSNQFEDVVASVIESAAPDNSFAEQIRKQRNALAASEALSNAKSSQQKALTSNSSACDVALRKCMAQTCGKDFTKCATDGDTIFGDKLNKCRSNTNCSAEEFNLFVPEIKADRDMNVRLMSYNAVLDCGNNYNACIINECGTTYNKCLGKTAADAAVQKCSIIAKECQESDSGLASRFGDAMARLRINAEEDIAKDEKRLYDLRDLMSKQCKSLGATFDERSFDCVYTVEFYAGTDQSVPTASRKAYAGDSFVCTQEWFGVNATTYKENAYRETRAQTAASSAMLGSGVGTAAGLISSGAIDRAVATQKAKKSLKEECQETPGKQWKNNKCIDAEEKETKETNAKPEKEKKEKCKIEHALFTEGEGENCIVKTCMLGYTKSEDNKSCVKKEKECKINNALTIDEATCTVITCEDGYTENKNKTRCVKNKSKTTDSTSTTSSGMATAGGDCTATVTGAKKATYNKSLDCIVQTCNDGYKRSTNNKYCIQDTSKQTNTINKDDSTNSNLNGSIAGVGALSTATTATALTDGIHSHPASTNGNNTTTGTNLVQRPGTTANPQKPKNNSGNVVNRQNNSTTPKSTNTNTNANANAAVNNNTTTNNASAPQATTTTKLTDEPVNTTTTTNTTVAPANNTTNNTLSTQSPAPKNQNVSPDRTTDNDLAAKTGGIYPVAKLSDIDVSKRAIVARARLKLDSCSIMVATDEYNGDSDKIECDDLPLGTWEAKFAYGKISGTYKCSNVEPNGATYTGRAVKETLTGATEYYQESVRVGNPGNTSGNHCYCGATEPTGSNWVYVKRNMNTACESICAQLCAHTIKDSEASRKAMFNKR